METKIEYELTPELAEKLALEQASLRLTSLKGMRWIRCILLGVFFAILFFNGCSHPQINTLGDGFLHLVQGFATVTGFGFGFGICCLGQTIFRGRVSDHVRQEARNSQKKFGQKRSVSWNSDSFVVTTPMSETRIKWCVIDELVDGEIGIHFLSGKQVIWGISKAAIPPNLSVVELVSKWRICLTKPPKLT